MQTNPSQTPRTITTTVVISPAFRTTMRLVWGLLMVIMVMVYITGLIEYNGGMLRVGVLGHDLAGELRSEEEAIYEVTHASPYAQEAGLHVGDTITDFAPDYEGQIDEEYPITILHDNAEPQAIVLTLRPLSNALNVLMKLRLSETAGRIVLVALDALMIGSGVALACFIFWKRSDDWMAVLTSLMIVSLGSLTQSFWTVGEPFGPLFIAIGGITLLLFPNGVLRPRWSMVIVFWIILMRPVILPLSDHPTLSFVPLLFGWGPGLLMVSSVLVYRYRYTFTQLERQQAKWLILATIGLASAFSLLIFGALLNSFGLRVEAEIIIGLVDLLQVLMGLFMMISIAFAILRFGLWEIDLVINRSLVYGAIAFILISIFFILLVGLQVVVGQQQPLIAFGIAMAFSAVTFNPLRRRIQNIVDRRIYGFAFDLNELKDKQISLVVKNPGNLTGEVIDGYQVLGVLGAGGMGEVYKGQKGTTQVAIKTMLPSVARDPDIRVRFEREAEIGLQFDHPNIVKVHTHGDHNHIPYLIMDFVEGQTLRDILKEQGAFDLATAIHIMHELGSALELIHKAGLVHRDLKPSNVMIRPNGEVVLMDFGIAKMVDATDNLTGTGAIGTIDYMAPEQIVAAREVDQRADIYALGAVLYELITGQKLFSGGPSHVLFAHLQQAPPDPRDVNADIPRSIAKAIYKALEKDPLDRFDSSHSFISQLAS